MSQFYIGTKQIFAWPETRDGQPGYAVCYQYGQPNEYHSWSPKDVFEASYLPMGHESDGSKITQAMVDAFIATVETQTLAPKTTVVKATLVNGFEIVESSSCVDAANYDEAMGREICLGRIKDRVWHLLGFLLQTARNGVRLVEPE